MTPKGMISSANEYWILRTVDKTLSVPTASWTAYRVWTELELEGHKDLPSMVEFIKLLTSCGLCAPTRTAPIYPTKLREQISRLVHLGRLPNLGASMSYLKPLQVHQGGGQTTDKPRPALRLIKS